ncbi:MAG: baseplate J/gp47 family protein [Oscillospiraceae bacterium]|nr:baseplate J/gp47 family protein [Oscillospiraceae bacterium]
MTDRGFRRPSYPELLDALEYKARELFGAGANLTVRSPLGLFCRIFAWMLSLLFGLLEDVYNSRFIDTAVGTSLLQLGRMIGLRILSNQKATGYLEIRGDPGTVIPAGWLAANVEGVQVVVVVEGVIGESGVITLPAQATQPGETGNLPAGSITTVVNPVIPAGVDGVTNQEPFSGGRLRETDEEYRDRYYKSVDFAGGVNRDAIRAEILQEGVVSAEVYENDGDDPDPVTGLPPHSVECVVYGGLDTNIAKAIYRRKAAGIQHVGDVTVAVLMANGKPFDIHFSRPTPVPVWVKLWGLETSGDYPRDGAALIVKAITDYIGGDNSGGLGIGEDLRYKRLSAALVAARVPGLLDFEMKISADEEAFGYENIPISLRQKAVTDESRVIFDA